MRAQGKRILVIGGEAPVGRAIVIGMAEAGANVAIASLTTDTQAEFAINSALNEVWAIGRKGAALPIDATDPTQLRYAIESAEAELGALDAVIAVATDADGIGLRAAFPGQRLIIANPEADPSAALEGVVQELS